MTREEIDRFERYLLFRLHFERLWEVVSKPIKFPKPRRRGDPARWPKAA